MAENDWKKRLGVVYSTAEDFGYVTQDDAVEAETPEPGKQKLAVTFIEGTGAANRSPW